VLAVTPTDITFLKQVAFVRHVNKAKICPELAVFSWLRLWSTTPYSTGVQQENFQFNHHLL